MVNEIVCCPCCNGELDDIDPDEGIFTICVSCLAVIRLCKGVQTSGVVRWYWKQLSEKDLLVVERVNPEMYSFLAQEMARIIIWRRISGV